MRLVPTVMAELRRVPDVFFLTTGLPQSCLSPYPKCYLSQFVKNAAPLNFNVRMANAYLLLCIVMGAETAWTTQMRKVALSPGLYSVQKER